MTVKQFLTKKKIVMIKQKKLTGIAVFQKSESVCDCCPESNLHVFNRYVDWAPGEEVRPHTAHLVSTFLKAHPELEGKEVEMIIREKL